MRNGSMGPYISARIFVEVAHVGEVEGECTGDFLGIGQNCVYVVIRAHFLTLEAMSIEKLAQRKLPFILLVLRVPSTIVVNQTRAVTLTLASLEPDDCLRCIYTVDVP